MRKAVIPAAGLATRFLPATKAMPKGMLPVVDKPAIQWVVEEAVRAGLDDILIITSPGERQMAAHLSRDPELESALERRGKGDLAKVIRGVGKLATIAFIEQAEPRGLGHAVSLARRHVGDESFAVLLGDDIFDERSTVMRDMVDAHTRFAAPVIALEEVHPSEISSYGCAAVEPLDGERDLLRLTALIEKPSREEAPSNLAVVGRYVFGPSIFDALDRITPGAGGELQLTDAIAIVLAAGDPGVYGQTFAGGHFDTGNKPGYLRAVVELALERDDLGPAFREFLGTVVKP